MQPTNMDDIFKEGLRIMRNKMAISQHQSRSFCQRLPTHWSSVVEFLLKSWMYVVVTDNFRSSLKNSVTHPVLPASSALSFQGFKNKTWTETWKDSFKNGKF